MSIDDFKRDNSKVKVRMSRYKRWRAAQKEEQKNKDAKKDKPKKKKFLEPETELDSLQISSVESKEVIKDETVPTKEEENNKESNNIVDKLEEIVSNKGEDIEIDVKKDKLNKIKRVEDEKEISEGQENKPEDSNEEKIQAKSIPKHESEKIEVENMESLDSKDKKDEKREEINENSFEVSTLMKTCYNLKNITPGIRKMANNIEQMVDSIEKLEEFRMKVDQRNYSHQKVQNKSEQTNQQSEAIKNGTNNKNKIGNSILQLLNPNIDGSMEDMNKSLNDMIMQIVMKKLLKQFMVNK
ncbi:hypothetical protein [Selenihalanaerobacter shriftii]|uniref:Uncharacterized protein n=1 Tax=Selenihalanaerobacter shriftii TaxID=142842 RepID=A0A1T4QSN6_9FIRM|nr:hypothetical protein [Selenihalanaerobacter shriftii]SKA06793.1 hypothetical protein SAMN02745118_02682 [Selenihalanaerobacter shriftii]